MGSFASEEFNKAIVDDEVSQVLFIVGPSISQGRKVVINKKVMVSRSPYFRNLIASID